MDLLTGYGSDVSSGPEEPAAKRDAGHERMLASIPAPSTSSLPSGGDAMLGNLPPPRRSKKAATFRIPVPVIPDSDEEDQPRKRVRLDTRGKRLEDVLPSPKNIALGAALGAGGGARLMTEAAKGGEDSDDEFRPTPPTGDGVLGGREAYVGNGNEAFRIADDDDAVPSAGPMGHNGIPGRNGNHGGAQPDHGVQVYYGGGLAAHAGPGSAAAPAADGERMLQDALAADAKTGARKSASAKDPFADLGVKFVEVKQAALKHVTPMAREAANAARSAFGPDYEARLRQEAGPQPEKLARRKHQISSLYHQAKMKELELLETRSAGMKTKAETQAKYGW